MAETPKTDKIPGVNVNYKHHREHIDACEESDEGHVVQPTVWPPISSDNSMGLTCLKCKASVIVYGDNHHTGVTLDKSKVRKAPAA